jgi:hypothetical protein
MITLIAQHQFWTAVAGYWILSAAVSSLPEPGANSNPVYLWLYRFLHTIAGNITTALGSKIPGVRAAINGAATTLLLLFLASCTAHYSIHPGALNKSDSAAYDTLLIAENAIDQARLDFQAGQLPEGAKSALETLIRSYNVARTSWLVYRGALSTNVESQQYFDGLTKNLTDLSAAIRGFEEAMK